MTWPDSLSKVLSGVSRIRMKGGLFAKTCIVLIVFSVSMVAIAWAVRDVWTCRLALFLVALPVVALLWRVVSFANRNPEAAILDGAEFLIHKQMLLGTKEQPELPAAPSESPLDAPILDVTDPEVLEPDSEESPTQRPTDGKEGDGGPGDA